MGVVGYLNNKKIQMLTKKTKDIIDSSLQLPIGGRLYDRRQVICTMTTIPARLPVLHNSILSIMHQSVKPHKIVIYLGKELFEGVKLPEQLLQLQEAGVEFRYVKDLRVHTKYYYALQEFNDSLVMTFDDDVMYHPDVLKELLKKHEKYPNCVITGRAHEILSKNNGSFEKYDNWKWDVHPKKPSHLLFVTGVGGALYDPRLFTYKDTFNSGLFLRLTPNNDDLWLKCVEFMSGIPIATIYQNKWYVNVENSQEVSLRSKNVHENRNDTYWTDLTDYFHISYKDLKVGS